jgi:alkylation response protein AidB-like acyl-CoA dehydrogenase
MASKWIDERDIRFLLFEVFNIGETLLGKGRYADNDADTVNMTIDAAAKLAVNEIAPTYPDEVQKKPVEATFKEGKVFAPEAYHRLYKLYTEGGWMTTSESYELNGQQLPAVVSAATANMFLSCNQAFLMYPGLTHGAARLVEDYFQHELRAITLEKMYSGEWAGTMCLTEPGAGSDVGALKSTAKRNADGTFTITGTKSFISAGDHDLTPNIIHPVLARIEGDPEGTKGISIFIVPKHRYNATGAIGENNDVTCGNIESKMGIHGNATCTLNFGENGKCIGYLMGEERQGMPIMFHMMNEERQGVGMMGVSLAGAAFQHALSYAKERVQGKEPVESVLDPNAPAREIIKHPDVRRMLLKMKSGVEGIRALCYFCYYGMDRFMIAETEEEKTKWIGMIEMLTPMVKAYCTDLGMEINSMAVQTYGGYGFCREYPVEQMMRDQKINQIYEGTNGIQALDLLGRKLGMKKGAYFMTLLGEIQANIAEAKAFEDLAYEASIVEGAMNAAAGLAMGFRAMLKTNPYNPLINACDFLNALSEVIVGSLHCKMAAAAKKGLAATTSDVDKNYYTGKIEGARFYIQRTTALVPAKCQLMSKIEESAHRITEAQFAV